MNYPAELSAQRHAWYSESAARLYGTAWYYTPSGHEIEVTAVLDPESRYGWEDRIYLGIVTTWARAGRPRPDVPPDDLMGGLRL